MAAKPAKKSTKKSQVTEKTTVKATATSGSIKFLTVFKKAMKNLKETPIFAVMLAEFIGTTILTITFIQMQSYPIYLGYAVVGIALLVGGVSGAHLNPAMTFGAWVTRKVKAITALGYVAAQVLGATVGWLIVKGFVGASDTVTAVTASTMYTSAAIPEGKEWFLFFAEFLGATLLGLGIAAAIYLKKNRIASSTVAGMSVLSAFYITMVITSTLLNANGETLTFLNPAIAGVLNVFSGEGTFWAALSIYVVAPILGGTLGFGMYELMQNTSDDKSSEGCNC